MAHKGGAKCLENVLLLPLSVGTNELGRGGFVYPKEGYYQVLAIIPTSTTRLLMPVKNTETGEIKTFTVGELIKSLERVTPPLFDRPWMVCKERRLISATPKRVLLQQAQLQTLLIGRNSNGSECRH